jgi:hypothetical protein
MNGAKLAGLVVIGILLVATVGAANVATAADRTVLSGEYATTAIEEEGSYDAIRNETIEQVLERMQDANLSEGQTLLQAGNGTDNRTLVENAVTESYVREQTNENVEQLYAYLNGDQEDLYMELDLRPLKESLAEEFGTEVERKETSALVTEFGPEDSETPVPIDAETVEKMKESPEGYQQARLDFRVDVAYAATTTDQKLLLIGENPREYTESEKDDVVDRREDEIRAELRDQLETNPDVITIEGERIDVGSEIQQRRADAKDDACSRTKSKLNATASDFQVCNGYTGGVSGGTASDNMTQAAVEFQYVIIDGLTEDRYDYETFIEDQRNSESVLSRETGDLAEVRIEQEVPNTLSAEDQFGQDTVNSLEGARGVVGAVGLGSLLLPVLALVLVGAVYGITRSVDTTAKTAGVALAAIGLVSLVVATALQGTVTTAVENAATGSDAESFAGIAVTLVEGMLSTLATQSAALLIVGVVLVALVAANRRGHLDELKARAGIGSAAASADGEPTGQAGPRGHQPDHQQAPPQDGGGSPGSGGGAGQQSGHGGNAGGQGSHGGNAGGQQGSETGTGSQQGSE